MGFFWKRAEAKGALAASIGTFVFSTIMLCFFPEISFIDRMGYVFLLCVLLIVILGLCSKQEKSDKSIEINSQLFATTRLFKILSLIILLVLSIIYYIFW